MKNLIRYPLIVLLLAGLIIILHSCKKQELPVVTTAAITDITTSTAPGGGMVTNKGCEPVHDPLFQQYHQESPQKSRVVILFVASGIKVSLGAKNLNVFTLST